MANIYRKAALDKISSPEQLDKTITIISPSFWIAAAGGFLILIVALVWSIFGRIPVNVSSSGIYMGSSGIRTVVAEADGLVDEVYVSEGDAVKMGQAIAKLDSGMYDEELAKLQRRRLNVESVTFSSSGDPATADTKPLLDIKAQLDVNENSLTADQISLRERERALSQQCQATYNARAARNSARSAVETAQAGYIAAQAEVSTKNDEFTKAQEAYRAAAADPSSDPAVVEKLRVAAENAQKALRKAQTDAQTREAELNEAQSAYSQAEQTYSAEKTAQKQIEDAVSQLEARVRADDSVAGSQYSSLEKQFKAAKGAVIDQLDQEIAKQQESADRMTLKSRIDGKVSGLNIAKGNAVQAGTAICRIKADRPEDDAVLYVPVAQGKKIKKDMKVTVYPSTVNRQEYGHIEGVVTGVSDSVVSSEEMLNQLGDSTLVQAYQQRGPVVRATVRLLRDDSTASGYKWSSRKGRELTIDEGTVIDADVVTEEKAPISMLIPYLKDKLSVDKTDDQSAQDGQSESSSDK